MDHLVKSADTIFLVSNPPIQWTECFQCSTAWQPKDHVYAVFFLFVCFFGLCLEHRDFSRFLKSIDDKHNCRWWETQSICIITLRKKFLIWFTFKKTASLSYYYYRKYHVTTLLPINPISCQLFFVVPLTFRARCVAIKFKTICCFSYNVKFSQFKHFCMFPVLCYA